MFAPSLLFLCLLSIPLVATVAAPPAPGATILIIRHAEKPLSGQGLSPAGEQRAQSYVRYFQTLREGGRPLKPDALFAMKDSDNSARPRLTLEPLAHALNLPIETEYKSKNTPELAALLRSPRCAGHTALICWRHGELPELLAALGANPESLLPYGEWPETAFNWLIELQLGPDGALRSSRIINERLMPDDHRDPPAVAPR